MNLTQLTRRAIGRREWQFAAVKPVRLSEDSAGGMKARFHSLYIYIRFLHLSKRYQCSYGILNQISASLHSCQKISLFKKKDDFCMVRSSEKLEVFDNLHLSILWVISFICRTQTN